MKTLHLFAGAGGGLLADLILGHEPIGAVEWDPYCCEILRERRDDGWFPNLRVHEGDIREFDASEYAGRVDCVAAGVPCPLWSSARAGRGCPPDMWPSALAVIGVVRPGFVFFENVPGFVAKHPVIRSDLGRIGYALSRPLITDAAGVGAPFARPRYWSLARANSNSEPMGAVDAEMADLQAIAGPVSAWSQHPDLGVDDGATGTMDQYRAAGNAQVPLQAAMAWRILSRGIA
jgi:site-specific DNA-cytosine methylase